MPDKETVRKVAEIARLDLTENELEKMSKDLEDILSAFSDIDKAKSSSIKPSFQPFEMENVLREDKVEKSLPQGEALKNAKHKEKGYFKGPKAI